MTLRLRLRFRHVPRRKFLERGVPGGIAQCATALRAQIVVSFQVDPPLPRVPGTERLALAATAAQRLRPCRSRSRSPPLIDVRRHVQIHHPDHLHPTECTFRSVIGPNRFAAAAVSFNLLLSPRAPPSGRAGATWTAAGAGLRPTVRSVSARSGRSSPDPVRDLRALRAPSAAAASRRGGSGGRAAPAGVPVRARSSGAPARDRRPRTVGRAPVAPPRAA